MKGLRLLPQFSNHDHGIIVTRHNKIPPSKASIFLESEPCSILKLAGARQYNGNARLCNAELLWDLASVSPTLSVAEWLAVSLQMVQSCRPFPGSMIIPQLKVFLLSPT